MSRKVTAWLEELGLGQYAQAFEENAIDAAILPELTDTDLKELGVTALGHRKLILKSLASVPAAAASSQAPGFIDHSRKHAPGNREVTSWSRTPGERKPVTMLFADIVGSTAATEKLDAEDAHDLLYQATQRMCQAVENNRGTVCRFMGDGLMAMFGAPMASEIHALEACRAALEMQDSINQYAARLAQEQDSDLQIRVGLHSGEVVVLEVGDDPDKPEFDASGATVPLAARMEQSADPGRILITEQTRLLAGPLVVTSERPAIEVKGIAEPVAVYRLEGLLSAGDPSADAEAHTFVGRHSELAQFRGIVQACIESDHGQTVFVRGEAGIGKTRLVQELSRIAAEHGIRTCTTLVLDFGAGKGQGAIPSLLRKLLGIEQGSGKRMRQKILDEAEASGVVDPDDRVFLNDLLDLEQPLELSALYEAMEATARMEGRCTAVAGILQKLAARQPLLLVIEDLHWADDETLEHLAHLNEAAASCPALLVATSRAEGDPLDMNWRARAGDSPFVTWDLSPLRIEESRKLAAAFIDTNDEIAGLCIERAAGNPLFLEQLLLGIDQREQANMPDSIKSLVLSRMDQLAPRDKLALRTAAVLGQRFDMECLRTLIEEPEYDCQSLVAHHLVRPEGKLYLFAHALIQEGAYASLLKSQRQDLHRRAADWFAERDAVLHAEHLDRAESPAAAEAYRLAAQQQAEYHRHERALQLVRRGLEIASPESRYSLTCLEGDLLVRLGSVSESIETYRRAEALADSDPDRCNALIGIAEGLSIKAEHEAMLGVLEEAKKLARADQLSAQLSRIFRLSSGVFFFRGETQKCFETGLEALEYARHSDSLELQARALSTLADAEYNRGRLVTAFDHFDRCVELAREHGFGRLIAVNLAMRGVCRQWINQTNVCISDAHEALDVATRTRDHWAQMIALIVGASANSERGNFQQADEWLNRGLEISRQLNAGLLEAAFLYYLAKNRVLEDSTLTSDLVAQAIEALQRSEAGLTFHGAGSLGLLALATDDESERRSALQRAEAFLSGGSVGHNHLEFYEYAMESCLQAGEWDEVDRYAGQLEEFTRAEPLPRSQLFVARGRLLAALGRGEQGPQLKSELQRIYDQAFAAGSMHILPAIQHALASIEA